MSASTGGTPTRLNHLANETSPYLLQHVHNPVDWYPWGEEALEKARREDKPIFLSIGYAACHWCHVMERESFEDEAIGAYLNAHFVSIKVDREERPDLDDIYMTAVQLMTGQGGWPMSMFLTPDLKPFYGGTYFPPSPRMGMPGFSTILQSIQQAWQERRGDIVTSSDKVAGYIVHSARMAAPDGEPLTEAFIDAAVEQLARSYDKYHGGFGDAPKFPSAPSMSILLRQFHRTGDTNARDIALHTLSAMARGGMYDHVGGGFHRYSVDEEWLVPHFEKMLYDNAQLAPVYLEAYQLTGDPFYRKVAEEIFAYQLREMTDETGGFYSTEDADSEGEEGKFYIWNWDELAAVLGKADASLFAAYYHCEKHGNFTSHESYHEGLNIPHIRRDPARIAEEHGIELEELEQRMAQARQTLYEVRAKRVRPGLDDKILTAWNGMMISALARGHQVLDNSAYLEAAERAADFLLNTLRDDDGGLLRVYRRGVAKGPAFLEDYANLVNALVDLHEASYSRRWLGEANQLAAGMIERFWDAEGAGFFMTHEGHGPLIARQKPTYDGSEPSGNAVAVVALLRLALHTGNGDYRERAVQTMGANLEGLRSHPQGYLKMLEGLDYHLHAPKEIVVVGKPAKDATRALIRTVHASYLPNKAVALVDPADGTADGMASPLLEGKTPVNGQSAAFVCENYACQQPVTESSALAELLKR